MFVAPHGELALWDQHHVLIAARHVRRDCDGDASCHQHHSQSNLKNSVTLHRTPPWFLNTRTTLVGWTHFYRAFMAQLFGNSFPASRIAIEPCRSCRLLRMTGATISPHCTQRFAANSVSPMQKSKSIQKSVTMRPLHLVHVDSCGTEEETL